jgi:P-type E1-E2 ATPase
VIEIDVPGWKGLRLLALVLDVNGTLALDGKLLNAVAGRLELLRSELDVHLLSADTYGQLDSIARQLNVKARRLTLGDEVAQKVAFVQELGSSGVAAIGNGINDVGMLSEAALGIAVMGQEGLAVAALLASDIVVESVYEALDLLTHPKRLAASLRR